MLTYCRNKKIACLLAIMLLLDPVLMPIRLLGLSGGPSQPEVQSFTPHEVTQLVDPFTGDFTYNIPLLDVGGYPINITYRSGIGMEDEASFVGLGWNLNPGVINRQVRGLPDDFEGDAITKSYHMQPDKTIGISVGADVELFGFESGSIGLGVQVGVNNNTYRGIGASFGLTPSIQAGSMLGSDKLSGSLSVNVGISSEAGTYISPKVGFSVTQKDAFSQSTFGLGIGTSWSSREGLEYISFDGSFKRKWEKDADMYERSSRSIGGSFPLTFASPTFTPTSEIPMTNLSGTFHLKVGGEVYGTMVDGFGSGYFTRQEISEVQEAIPAYGYMYALHAGDGRVLTDFNREKDGPYQKENPNLPLTNFTYDVFAVSGQGMNGQFRPFRGDIGMLGDPKTGNQSTGISAGGEVALGALVHGGAEIVVNLTNDQTQKWVDTNPLAERFRFQDHTADNPLYESIYFKSVGEKTMMVNEDLFNRTGRFDPVYVPIGDGSAEARLVNPATEFSQSIAPDQNYKQQREPRNIHFSWLTAREASYMGVDSLWSYMLHGRSWYIDDIHGTKEYFWGARRQKRIDGVRKPHHISEVIVTRDDGARYVYGLPVYNTQQKEVTFNASKSTVGAGAPALSHDPATGWVTYDPAQDNSDQNRRGLNHYYQATETPPYAHAFLLTSVLSDDYVDVTANGPTPDDFGTYTRFNYTKVHDQYRWRSPYQQNIAWYQAGHESDALDDMGSYVYGEKEIWYLINIETKNYVAEFSLSDREDGLGVKGENGGADPEQRLKKLDKITLYNQADRIHAGPDAVPVKTVYFTYDYSLCQNTPDATGGQGKLTLKKISFSYGNSDKERFSPFAFTYNSYNPNYASKGADRWGSYKENDPALSNTRFPYTTQDKTLTDRYVAAWHLTRIALPSGGIVNVAYESDEYAYVQDRRTMEMTSIMGFRNNVTDTRSLSASTDNLLYQSDEPRSYIFFELKQSTSDPRELAEYTAGIEELYFNCMVNVNKNGDPDLFESIEGFIPVHLTTFDRDYGFFAGSEVDGKYTKAWIQLPIFDMGNADEPVVSGSEGAHPIAKATWQTLRSDLPRIAYDEPEPHVTNDFTELLGELDRLLEETANIFNGFNSWKRDEQRGKKVDLSQSFIRLNSPYKSKLGGGVRVKQITINDQWGNMVSSVPEITDFSYGKEYIYTVTEPWGDTTREISAGVAAYEPLLGGDENPFALPSRYRINKLLALGLNLYMMEPFGESFFPGSHVGYRQVKIRNLAHENVTRTATGFTEYEFYTAKDFPTLTRQTAIDSRFSEVPPNPFYSEKKATVSQGYCIELNDMHGKPKVQKVYQETDAKYPISGVEYIYQTHPEDVQRLDNTVTVFNEASGRTEEKLVGVECDFIVDAREMKRDTYGPGAQINTDGFLAAIFPIFIPMLYPEYSEAHSQYRGIVTTKVVQRSGILKEIIAYDMGSRVTTQNLVYDGKTGNVLITKTQNEFEDDYFTTQIPAHWVYEGMGSAYKNTGLIIHDKLARGGVIEGIAQASNYFVRGDELLLQSDRQESIYGEGALEGSVIGERPVPPERGWVMQVNENSLGVIDRLGQPITDGTYMVAVLRSGRRNKPFAPVGSVTTRVSPINASQQLAFDQVLDANAATYDEHWQTYAGFHVPIPQTTCRCRPVTGVQGVLNVSNLTGFLQTLMSSGDVARDEVDLSLPPYAGLSSFFSAALGPGSKTYHGEINGTTAEGILRSVHEGVERLCYLTLAMEDGTTAFPGSIIALNPAGLVSDDYTCGDVNEILANIQYIEGEDRKERQMRISTTCFPLFTCTEVPVEDPDMVCDLAEGARVNPFLLGILGHWRPQASYVYVTERETGRIREKGTFREFHSFWQPIHFSLSPARDVSRWQRATLTTITDPFGKALESRDALNRYTGVNYGYNFTVPTATATNARYHQIAYDGFEDYAYRNFVSSPFEECPLPSHWRFTDETISIVAEESHTGKHSLRVSGGESISSTITPLCDPAPRSVPAENTYVIQDCDLIRKFAPTAGEYILSAWVKEETPASAIITSYERVQIEVQITRAGISRNYTFQPEGSVVDGWQPVSGSFTIPSGAQSITVRLNSSATAYFDDIRLQPFHASMETYVYDPENMRLAATLDVHNFATLHEYDGEGLLTRTKKETERGIMTLQEVRSAKPR